MNQAAIEFSSLELAALALPGIIRTLPENCRPQVKLLTDALMETAIRKQLTVEPHIPPFDLSRFAELCKQRISTLSPTDAQYMIRATVSYLFTALMIRRETDNYGSEDINNTGYAQLLHSLTRFWELTPAMIVAEAIATGEALFNSRNPSPMKTLLTNITLTFVNRPYKGDLLMGLYHSTKHACLIFRDPDGETIAHLTAHALTGARSALVAIKDWSENEGVAPQLEALRDEDGNPLFLRSIAEIHYDYVKAPVFALTGRALDAFEELLKKPARS